MQRFVERIAPWIIVAAAIPAFLTFIKSLEKPSA